ncbi:MAG TPA: rhomboid family intramembrane serine protease [Thermoanaerobaculia bacterium]|nr:rhomboid family intramembrane serine protease [Thermoanaerobaculia bacterium]
MIPLRDDNPAGRRPYVTVALILVNAVLFLYELSLGPQGLQAFLFDSAFVPARMFEEGAGGLGFSTSSILLSMFLHGGWAHFLGNMLFLWVFGDNIEDELGHLRFVVFYLVAGFAAAFAHAFAHPASALPAIGASGAIAGVLGAYLLIHPKAPIVTLVFLGFFITTIRVPAIVYLPIWFLIQLVSGVASLGGAAVAESGGVAWFAHIGGFVAGPLLLLLLRRPAGGRRRRPGRPSATATLPGRYRTSERPRR